jgi:hypothetical protein
MATMPSRADTAPHAIASILAQVERLWLFLDRFEVIPPYAEHERIHVLRTAEVGDIRANGKLAGLARETTPCTFFSVDDDVEYPADYCDTLESGLAKYGGRAAVGVHAAIFSSPVTSYVRDMTVMHRRASLDDATEVDLLGTDSMAFRASTLHFDVREWEHVNLVDLSFARWLRGALRSRSLRSRGRRAGSIRSPSARTTASGSACGATTRSRRHWRRSSSPCLVRLWFRLRLLARASLSSERRLSRHAGVPVLRVRELRHGEVLLRVRVGARRRAPSSTPRGAQGRHGCVRRPRRLDRARRDARSRGRPRGSVAIPCTSAA